MKLSQLKTNVAAVENGVWMKDLPGWDGLELKVRGLNNSEYRALQRNLNEAIPRIRWQTGKVTPKEVEEISHKLLHQTVLMDWRGLEDENEAGNAVPLPYTAEKAWELLSNPEFVVFRDIVIFAASLVGSEAAEAEEADAKN